MRYKIVILSAFFCLSLNAFGENDQWKAGARGAGMGNASMVLGDTWSVFNNPAAIPFNQSISTGLFYENRYLVKELSRLAFAYTHSFDKAAYGISISHFGYSQYNENRFGLAYNLALSEKISLAVQLDYLNTMQTEEYDDQHIMSFDVGLLAEPVENLLTAVHVVNPAPVVISGSEEADLPVLLGLGLGYIFSENLIWTLEAEQDMKNDFRFATGMEYQLIQGLYMRTGIQTMPVQMHFGLGYQHKQLGIDIAYSWHRNLGNTPHISLQYAF